MSVREHVKNRFNFLFTIYMAETPPAPAADPNAANPATPADPGKTGAPDPSQDPKPSDPNGGTGDPKPADPSAAPPSSWDEIFQHPRFKQVIGEKNEAQQKLSEYEKAEAEAKEKAAIEAGEHQKIIDDLKPKAERADALEKVISDAVDEQLKQIPDDKKALIPDNLAPEAKFAYLAKNWKLLTGTERNIGHPAQPGKQTQAGTETFTQSQIQDPKFYQENREAIKLAQREGRIVEG